MKPIVLKGGAILGGIEFEGFIVPDTNGLLAIDERYPADPEDKEASEAYWKITHIPTMFSVTRYDYTDAKSKEQAAAIAQRFYAEAAARGWDLTSTDDKAITDRHNSMTAEEKTKFWEAVRGSPVSEDGNG